MKRKFFVNVPVLMGWVFSAMRLYVSAQTVAKFTVVSYGEQLVHEIGHEDVVSFRLPWGSPASADPQITDPEGVRRDKYAFSR